MSTPAISAQRARLTAIGIVVFCASLPLQWQTLANVPALGTLRWFHLGAVVMLALGWPAWPLLREIVKRSRPVPEGMIAFIACSLVTAIAWGENPADFVQRTVYCVVGLIGGASLLAAMSHAAGRRVLVWASLVTTVVFSFNFYLAMVSAHVDPVRTIDQAVIRGDPSIIEFSLFRSSFNGASDAVDVRSNARHEIFAALVIVFAVSLVAGAVTRATQVVLVLSGVLTLALVFISQSRSNLLAVTLALLVALIRVIVTRRIRAGTVAIGVLVVAGGVVAFKFVGQLVITRITQTQSYNSRIDAFDYTNSEIIQKLLFGGPRLDKSTHNLVGDAALRGGFMAAIGAVAILLAFFAIAVRCLRAYYAQATLAYFAAILCMAVAIVRSFTAGGGQLQLTEWFGVGLALTVLIRSDWGPDAPTPAAEEAPAIPVPSGNASVGAIMRTPPRPRREKISAGRAPAEV